MAVKILWYLTAPDGTIPWEPAGRWDTGFDHLQQLSPLLDIDHGFDVPILNRSRLRKAVAEPVSIAS